MKLNDYANMFKIDKEVLTLNDYKTSNLFNVLKQLRIDKEVIDVIQPYKNKVQNAFIAYGAEYFNSIHKREYVEPEPVEEYNEQKWLDTFKQEFQAILLLDEQDQIEYGEDFGINLYYELYNQMIKTNSLDEVDYSDVKKFRRMIVKKKLRSKPTERPVANLDIKQMLNERGIVKGKTVDNEVEKVIEQEIEQEIANEMKQGSRKEVKQLNGTRKDVLQLPTIHSEENPIEELKAEFLSSYGSLFPNETLFKLALDAYTSKMVLKLRE